MRCIITGTETDNKWKGHPISKNVIMQAKDFVKEDPKLTMRQAILSVAKVFKVAVNKKIDDKIKDEIKAKEEANNTEFDSTKESYE